VKRTTQLFGKEARDYIYETAFEYQQSDFHHFRLNDVEIQSKVRSIDNSNIANNVIEAFNKF
jgi:hypothetical protein